MPARKGKEGKEGEKVVKEEGGEESEGVWVTMRGGYSTV